MNTRPALLGTELNQTLQQIRASAEGLRCQNNYLGVPVLHPAIVHEILEDTLVLVVHPHQLAAAWTEKKIYLLHSLLPFVLKAAPVGFDFSARLLTVGGFAPAGPAFGKRQSLRVQPKDPVQALVAQEGIRMTATLADLSTDGVGVYTFAALLHEQVEFRRDDPITVGFHLPTYPRQLVINGYITNALKLRGNFIRRIGIRAAPEGEAAAALAEYINTRQAEIIQQLQGLSRDLANL